jgi:integrase
VRHTAGTPSAAYSGKLGVTQKEKDPLLVTDVRRLVAACPSHLLGLRDRALVLVGLAGAFWRSELATIEVRNLVFSESGVAITLAHSKTDQEGAGCEVAVPFGEHAEACPVSVMRAWLKAAGITAGAVFRCVDRHGHTLPHGLHLDSIGPILKHSAMRAGIDASKLTGHSMRAGMATQAAMNGEGERSIAKTTGHKSRRVLRRYIRSGQLFSENAAANLGL